VGHRAIAEGRLLLDERFDRLHKPCLPSSTQISIEE
jgi:hypothetical protein